MDLFDSHLLAGIIGLVTGMYGPRFAAWVMTIGEPTPIGRTARLRDLLDESPRTNLGRVPRQRGRHGNRVH